MEPNVKFNIDNKTIGKNQPTYFIADIAANHDGDISRAKELIYLAADAGADAAKFQHFQAETIVSDYGFKSLGSQQSHQSSWKKSVFEVYKDASVNLEWTSTLVETCKDAGISFFTTPYSLDVIEVLNKYVPAYKIGSGDITWDDMIRKIASKNKPYILATGAANISEVIDAVDIALEVNPDFCLMQCNTNYTASLENFRYINLNVLNLFKEIFPNLVLGLSDHTPGHSTVLGAITLGAKMIEKHFTDDNERVGPDHKFSMNPSSWREMVDRSRELENALGNSIKKVEENEIETIVLQRRSMRAIKDLNKGHIICESDFIPLRPCPNDAITPIGFKSFIGKKLSKDLKMNEYINLSFVEL